MKQLRGQILLITLCLSLGASRVQAGDQPASGQAGGAGASDATPVATGNPAVGSPAGKTRGERMADANGDSADNGHAAVQGEAADGSEASPAEGTGRPAVTANTDISSTSRAIGDQDLITMN